MERQIYPRLHKLGEPAPRVVLEKRRPVRVTGFEVERDIETSTAPHATVVDDRQGLERAVAEGRYFRVQGGPSIERQLFVRESELGAPAERTGARAGACSEIEQHH